MCLMNRWVIFYELLNTYHCSSFLNFDLLDERNMYRWFTTEDLRYLVLSKHGQIDLPPLLGVVCREVTNGTAKNLDIFYVLSIKTETCNSVVVYFDNCQLLILQSDVHEANVFVYDLYIFVLCCRYALKANDQILAEDKHKEL